MKIGMKILVLFLLNSVLAMGWNYIQGGNDWDGSCSSGLQSPIDLTEMDQGHFDGAEMDIYYPVVQSWQKGMKVEHTGNNIEVTSKGNNLGYIFYGGRKYFTRKLMFKAPAEHTIGNQTFAMELQIVHQRKGDNSKLILSVLYKSVQGSTSRAVQFLNNHLDWQHLPAAAGKRTLLTGPFALGLGIEGLLGGYYQYIGSLTEPPCSSGVIWNVLETVQEASSDQIFRINQLFTSNYMFGRGHGNNRALRPTAGHAVVLRNHKPVGDNDGKPIPKSSERIEGAHLEQVNGVSPEDQLVHTNGSANGTHTPRRRTLPALYADEGKSQWVALCASGRHQSPIDIQLAVGNPHGDFEMLTNYLPVHPANGLEHVGWTLMGRGNFGSMYIEGEKTPYIARRFFFHAPSEHTIDGRRAAMEVEIHHTSGSGSTARRAILSVLFYESLEESSEFLESLAWRMLPLEKGDKSFPPHGVNLALLKGLDAGYYSYAGSLSQPPCTEGIKRFVVREPNPVSKFQLQRFKRVFDGNFRPIQPANGRGVNVLGVQVARNTMKKYRNQPPIILA